MSVRAELVVELVSKYEFRMPQPGEGPVEYAKALFDHVKQYNFAEAYELAMGKRQRDWTPHEVSSFQDYMLAQGGPRREFAPGVEFSFPVVQSPWREEVSEAHLSVLADRGLQAVIDRRRVEPDWDIPILASVLLTTGELLTTSTQRGDRVAVLRELARRYAVFGFFIVFDTYMHLITNREKAERLEAVTMHIGTRDRRVARVAVYRRTSSGIVFDPTKEMDMRGEGAQFDPYAEVLISVPSPTGKPS